MGSHLIYWLARISYMTMTCMSFFSGLWIRYVLDIWPIVGRGGGVERVLVYVIGYNVCSATLSLMNSWPFLVHGKSYLVSLYIVNREA